MKKILLSGGIIAFAVVSVALGGTGAFFSDSENSVGNTFAAGAIDLKVDNTSYYNGTSSPNTSWSLKDLTIEKFFNFLDLKPGDFGEDTISLHVDTNDAYLCANITLTSNDDNAPTEPELLVDSSTGSGLGELAQNVNFIWWADDGDNVLEDNEHVITQGPIGALPLHQSTTFTLADSQTNIWTGVGGPVTSGPTYYVGKAWCFGTLTPAPLAQDGVNNVRTPANTTGGISCNGSGQGNETQTDSLTADVSFTAYQARHNGNFRCIQPTSLTLVKQVVNNNLGQAQVGAWTLSATGPTNISGPSGSSTVTNVTVQPGVYTLSESGPSGYNASSWSCNAGNLNGNTLTLGSGQAATCTIVNDDKTPLACTPGQEWADSAVSFSQGKRKDGTAVLANRSIPGAALGPAQTTGSSTDVGFPDGSFVSLGFGVNTTATRSLVLSFDDNLILNATGTDLKVYEVTGGVYPDEHVKIEASQDGTTWTLLAADAIRDADVDLGSLPWAKYVRLTDINVTGPFPNDADGYDVDAVKATNCVQPVQ